MLRAARPLSSRRLIHGDILPFLSRRLNWHGFYRPYLSASLFWDFTSRRPHLSTVKSSPFIRFAAGILSTVKISPFVVSSYVIHGEILSFELSF